VWAARHGHSAPVVHGLQVLSFSAPGATLFPHYIGEAFIAFTELSCKFLKEVHSGDTLYPALEIISLEKQEQAGLVTAAVSIFNQRNEMVLSGEHKYTLKLS
jgi:acyl dehydratase